jgi:hypothetical protein
MSDFDILILYFLYSILGILTSLRRLICLFLYIKIDKKKKFYNHKIINMQEKNYFKGEN